MALHTLGGHAPAAHRSLLDRLPGVRQWHQHAVSQRFAHNHDENLFLGVYDSFDDALAHAPRTRPVGYDNEASADLYVPCVYAWDYPALYWLERSLAEGHRSVFDLGGHVGIKYHAFRRLLPYPPDLRWTVCDVPAVVQRGRELAAARGTGPQLSFTTEPSRADGHAVLYASGSLQYLPYRLAELLGDLKHRPARLIINITPVHPERTFVTLNSIGTAVCPYRVFSHNGLMADLHTLGYTRRDEWESPGKTLNIPGEPALSLDHYTGFCLDG